MAANRRSRAGAGGDCFGDWNLRIRRFQAGSYRRDRRSARCLFVCVYNIGGHSILARYDRWTVLLYTTGSASLFWILVNSPWKIASAHYSAAQWLFLLFFSLLSVLAAFSFYFAGLQHLEPTRAVVVSCLEPVFSIVLAAILLGEVLRPLQALGIILVLAAIVVVQMPERQKVAEMTIIEPVD